MCYFHADHNGDGRVSIWCPVAKGVQVELVATDPGRFFEPPVSAGGVFSGWLGAYLDLAGEDQVDWNEVGALLRDAYRHVAPKYLVAELDEG